ncbi:MAG: hypothetical protein QM767_22785 [Anaeromyxobacter sp.]
MDDLLRGPNYIDKTIDEAIAKYAPRKDNNKTSEYQQRVRDAAGVSGKTRLSDLSDSQFERMERQMWREEGFFNNLRDGNPWTKTRSYSIEPLP